MDEYCSMEQKEFSLKWSRRDKCGKVYPMPSGEIIKSLRKLQMGRDRDIAFEAHKAYPDDIFSQYFSYSLKGHRTVMTSEKAIAKRYLQLTEK